MEEALEGREQHAKEPHKQEGLQGAERITSVVHALQFPILAHLLLAAMQK